MSERPASGDTSGSMLDAALLEYFGAPGNYQLTLRQPALLFSSVRDVLQIAAGNFGDRAPVESTAIQEAAAFFIRAAFLYPGADHYALFGLPSRTEPVELKDRYRLLMRLTHPDFAAASGSNWPADAAVRVNRAYEVLSSPVLRLEYDEQLASPAKQRPLPPARAEPLPRVAPLGEGATRGLNWKAVWILGSCGGVLLLLTLIPRQEPIQLVQNRSTVPASIASLPVDAPMVQPPPAALPVAPAVEAAPATLRPAAAPQPPPRPMAEAVPVAPAPVPRADVRPPASEPAPAPRQVLPASVGVQAAQPRAEPPPPPVVEAVARQPDPPAPPERQAAPPTPPPPPIVARPRDDPPPAAPVMAAAPRAVLASPETASPRPTLNDAQPLLSQLLHVMESGSGEQMLRLLEADARNAPAAQALSRQYEQVVRGGRPVRLTQVEFRSEGREGVLLVTGRIRLHAGEPTIGSHGERLSVRAEFVTRGGKVLMTGLSGGAD